MSALGILNSEFVTLWFAAVNSKMKALILTLSKEYTSSDPEGASLGVQGVQLHPLDFGWALRKSWERLLNLKKNFVAHHPFASEPLIFQCTFQKFLPIT